MLKRPVFTRVLSKSTAGVTLVEVLVAVVIMVIAMVSLSLFAPLAVKAIAKNQTRAVATSLASAKIEEVKDHPFEIIPVTPNGSYFDNSKGGCDCTSADFTQGIPGEAAFTSSETIQVGQILYTRQTCVNYVQRINGVGWIPSCSDNNGLKQIITNVSWTLGNEPLNYTMQSLTSPMSADTGDSQKGAFVITVCPADGNIPPKCDRGNMSAIDGAEVAVLNQLSNTVVSENAGNLPPNPVISTVPVAITGAGVSFYNILVQKTGYMPFLVTHSSVSTNSGTFINAILLDTARYGSNLTGEVFVSTRPTISKVIARMATTDGTCNPPPNECNDASEVMEIYNGTAQNVFMGCASANGPNCLSLSYCPNAIWCNNQLTGREALFANRLISPVTIPPGAFYLITGVDTNPSAWPNCISNPSTSNCPWGVVPDLMYDNKNSGTDLIHDGTQSGGGGLKLFLAGDLADSVRWQDNTGNSPAGKPWMTGVSVTNPNLNPSVCTNPGPPGNTCQTIPKYAALYRSNRRGQFTYDDKHAPGDDTGNLLWGPAYTILNDNANFGVSFQTPEVSPVPPLRNLTLSSPPNPSFLSVTGFPASLAYPNQAYIQVEDTVSTATALSTVTDGIVQDSTTLAFVGGIYGPDDPLVPGQAFQWPVIIAAGPYVMTFQSPFMNGPISANWPYTLFQNGIPLLGNPLNGFPPKPFTPVSPNATNMPWDPPQPCSGASAHCDTDQMTGTPMATYYGSNPLTPDQFTPYVSLLSTAVTNTSGSAIASVSISTWSLVYGVVTDTGNPPVPIPAVAVSITDLTPGRMNPMNPFEKPTDANGYFNILVPSSGTYSFTINSTTVPTVSPPIPLGSHYWNPHYLSFEALDVLIIPSFPGQSLGLSALINPVNPRLLQLWVNPAGIDTTSYGSISGAVTSLELDPKTRQPVPLSGITVELLSMQSRVLRSVTTDNTGSYSMGNVPTGTYYVAPVTDRHETAVPYTSPQETVTFGNNTGNVNFSLRGAPAMVTVTSKNPGTFAVVFSTSVMLSGPDLPLQTSQKSLPIYSATIPGGIQGGIYSSPPIAVPPAGAYKYCCWTPVNGTYIKSAVKRVPGAKRGILDPQANITVACP